MRIAGRPGRDHKAATVRVTLKFIHYPSNLVIKAGVSIFMNREMPPKIAVGTGHLPVSAGPRIPKFAAMSAKKVDVGLPGQKPEIFHHDIFPGNFFGG